jgi:Trypsin
MLCYAMLAIHAPVSAQISGPSIIGGQFCPAYRAPYQVSVKVNLDYSCGGVIVSDRWIITSASALIRSLPPRGGNVTIGMSYQGTAYNQYTYRVEGFLVHPRYNSTTLENDIVLLKTATPIEFSETVAPIEYANEYNTTLANVSAGQVAFLTGFGSTDGGADPSQNLQGTSMPLISMAEANDRNINPIFGGSSFNTRWTVLSTNLPFFQNGVVRGMAGGDRGGAAVINNSGNKINIGIASWAYPPFGQLPSVYTNIREYAEWIQSVTEVTNTKQGVDLYIQDKRWDKGDEPANIAPEQWYESDDIWVRNQNDALPDAHLNDNAFDSDLNQDQQNPIGNRVNYVYVRVRNRGSLTSPVGAKVKLYWAKASTALEWPSQWNGTVSVQGQPLGGIIGELSIPPTALVVQDRISWQFKIL